MKDFINNAIEKLKSIKKYKVIVVASIVALALIITSIVLPSGNRPAADTQPQNSPLMELENRLAEILSSINGAGRVDVMIMYSGSMELVLANTTTSSSNTTVDNSGGGRETSNNTQTSTPILVNRNGQTFPLVIKEIMPDITGVLIVAEGARNIGVRMEILRAVQTLLGVSAENVEILTMANNSRR
jgi:stage III sporulation protein AG